MPDAIVVPQPAVQQGQNGPFVFVVNSNNQAEVRWIVPGPWEKNDWVIWEGLKSGDQVIVTGVNKVLPASPVKIIPKDQDQVPENQQKTGNSGV